jgi:hypothetical protein
MSEREAAFDRAFDYLRANAIAGAVVEFGVHRGASLALLARRAAGRDLYGLDTFAGMPAPSEHDSAQFAEGQFGCSTALVRETLAAANVKPERPTLVAGLFADADPIDGPVALVHLDCDLYQSAVDGLRLVDPVDGAVVLIDDWYCHRARPDMGVRRAWSEWLRETGRSASWFDRYGWHGSAWVVHRWLPGELYSHGCGGNEHN